MNRILLIAGQIGSGKTAAASGVAEAAEATPVLVRDALKAVLGGDDEWDRARLQMEGAALDQRTNGRWLVDYLLERSESDPRMVVDAIRTRRQVEPILDDLVDCRLAYLSCSESTRRVRYSLGQVSDPVKRGVPFDSAMAHETEVEAATLRSMAHVVIETDDLSVDEVVGILLEAVGWSAAGA